MKHNAVKLSIKYYSIPAELSSSSDRNSLKFRTWKPTNPHPCKELRMAWLLHSFDCSSEKRSMTLKIKQVAGKREIRICLSGQLRCEYLDQLKSEVERGGPPVTLDL